MKIPAVYMNHNARIAIAFASGPSWVQYLSMENCDIHVRRLPSHDAPERDVDGEVVRGGFFQRYRETDYSVAKAAQRFLDATHMHMTERARKILDRLAKGTLNSNDEDITMSEETNSIISTEIRESYKVTKTKDGTRHVDNNDTIAKDLRGLDLDGVYKVASKMLGESVRALKGKYGKLNPGMQRMNLGNRMRKATRDKKKGA